MHSIKSWEYLSQGLHLSPDLFLKKKEKHKVKGVTESGGFQRKVLISHTFQMMESRLQSPWVNLEGAQTNYRMFMRECSCLGDTYKVVVMVF